MYGISVRKKIALINENSNIAVVFQRNQERVVESNWDRCRSKVIIEKAGVLRIHFVTLFAYNSCSKSMWVQERFHVA